MHTIVWVPLESPSWTDKLSSISGLAAAVISLIAVVLAYCAWRTSHHQLNASRAQDLALRLDAQLVVLSTSELAAIRDRTHALAHSHQGMCHSIRLDEFQRQDVFQFLWALQRVSVLTTVIATSSVSSITVLSQQITQIVDTLHTLGERLNHADKKSMREAVVCTEESLQELEESLDQIHQCPRKRWSETLHKAPCVTWWVGEEPSAVSGQVQAGDGVADE